MHAITLASVPLAITLSLFGGVHHNTQKVGAYHNTNTHHRVVVQKPVATNTTKTTALPVVAPKVTAPATVGTDYVSQVEQLIHTKINTERAKNGLSALNWDTTLSRVARAHSADMAKNNYFDHTNLEGCNSACRITNAGYNWSSVGENIYMESGYTLSQDAMAQMIVDGWMNSPGHRANVLNSSFTNEGIGVAQVGNSLYATEDFARPR